MQLVDRVPAEAAIDKTPSRQQIEPGLIDRKADAPCAEADRDLDLPSGELGGLDVEDDAVGELDPGDPEVRDLLGGDHARGLAELAVGERADAPIRLDGHGHGAARLVGRQDLGPRVGELDRTGHEDLRLSPAPELVQGLVHVGRLEVAGQLIDQRQVRGGGGEHVVIADGPTSCSARVELSRVPAPAAAVCRSLRKMASSCASSSAEKPCSRARRSSCSATVNACRQFSGVVVSAQRGDECGGGEFERTGPGLREGGGRLQP